MATTERRADPYAVLWMTDDGPAALSCAGHQLGEWLRERGVDVDLGRNQFVQNPDWTLLCMHHECDWRHDLQVRLTEHKANGDWVTELTVAATDKQGGWLRLAVSSSEGIYAGTPRLAGYLLESGLFRDGGSLHLTSSPQVVTLNTVEALAESLTDVTRQGIAFVAGSGDGLPFDKWSQSVRKWTKDVIGMGEVFVLDPPATRELTAILGEDFGTQPFTLRTYRPGVDPAVYEDAGRHRYLSTQRLADSSVGGIQRLLGRITREHNATRPLPSGTRAVFRAFSRLENQVVASSLVQVSPTRPEATAPTVDTPLHSDSLDVAVGSESLVAEVERYTRDLETVRAVLGIEIISEESLSAFTRRSTFDSSLLDSFRDQLDKKQDAIDTLETRLEQMNETLFELQFSLDTEVESRGAAEDEARYLRSRLRRLEDWEAANSVVPVEAATEYPESFATLIDWLLDRRLQGVIFTGERKTAEELDEHYDVRAAVRTAWEACLALADFVRYRKTGHDCSVFAYLKDSPSDFRKVPMRKYAATESETVVNSSKWARERRFPVPASVDPSGFTEMFAHFKCPSVGMVSPRLHYLDDVSRTGLVYIGYIGRHLTNTMTN